MGFSGFEYGAGFGTQREEVALHYVFDFDDSETVVYIGEGPFPGRVFVLRFWRYAKEGIMHLLGYRHQGHWRDPTLCYPNSYVRYYRPQHHHPLAHPPHTQPGDTTAHVPPGRPPHEQPADTTQRHYRQDQSIEQLAYRVPLLKLAHDVWELPTLKGQPVHLIANAQRFPKLLKATSARIPAMHRPPLNTPMQKTVVFVALSAHFQNIPQAEHELAGIVKVMRQFPQLRVTIQGNFANSFVPSTLLGFGAAARADQNRGFDTPATTRWLNGMESYNSNGQIINQRARTIQQYLISKGINTRRVTTMRGQYTTKRSATIIFSN